MRAVYVWEAADGTTLLFYSVLNWDFDKYVTPVVFPTRTPKYYTHYSRCATLLLSPSFFICRFDDMLGHGSDASAFSANHITFSEQPQRVLRVQDPVIRLHSIIRLPIQSSPVFRPPAYLAQETTDNIHKHAADRTKTGDSRKRHLQRQIPVGVCHKAGWVVVDWVDRGFFIFYFLKKEKKKVCKASSKHRQRYRCVCIIFSKIAAGWA